MSKAEEFIREHTKGCSNIIKVNTIYGAIEDKEPWLTPEDARRAVEIAREELLDEVCEWLKENTIKYITSSLSGEYTYGLQMQIFDDLRKAMRK